MEDLQLFVKTAAKQGASDLHLAAESLPFMRVKGALKAMKEIPLKMEEVRKMVVGLLSQEQLKELAMFGDVDVGVNVAEIPLRLNIHKQTLGFSIAARLLPSEIPTPEKLGFYPIMLDIPKYENGLVVFSGPAGSGKSTSLAAIIESINKTQAQHIITLEDPIEYRFKQKKSLIEQRQLGTDFPTFAKGLRHVLRQDPNVIVVGEMRDPETISLALTAAETGHLVLSTLHAPNASEVIERIVTIFEGAKQQQILVQLAACIRMVVSQQLRLNAKGDLTVVREILTSTPAIQNAIRQNKLGTIRSAIQTGRKDGMISMEQALALAEK